VIIGGRGVLGSALRAVYGNDTGPENALIYAKVFHPASECEKRPDKAFGLNATIPFFLAKDYPDKVMVYISTDYVFSGKLGNYTEYDPPAPANTYGVSKYAGELMVAQSGVEYLIIRTSTFFGPSTKGFVRQVLDRGAAQIPLLVMRDVIVSPTYVPDLAKEIKRLIDIQARGVYHVTSGSSVTLEDLAKTVLTMAGFKTKIELVDALPGDTVRRPRNASLRSVRLEQPMRDWRMALEAWL
jgi:dTDP-4-dehydrorhamnose reductase